MTNAIDPKPVRRVVTGHTATGEPIVTIDGIVEHVQTRPNAASTTIWASLSSPAKIDLGESGADHAMDHLGSGAPKNGSRFMIMDLMPGLVGKVHRTETLDYVICIEGEVEMQLASSTVTLKAGDVLIQQATLHAWMNKTGERARVAIVLVDAVPSGPDLTSA